MKQGQNLQEIAVELERQVKSKKDFIAPATELEMDIEFQSEPALKINGYGSFPLTEKAHEQVAGRLGIPQKYYDRMKTESPELLRDNVNVWLKKDGDPKLVRTLDGRARAFLSHRYRPLDNYDLAEVALPIIQSTGCTIESSALTPNRLYIKALSPRITTEISKGDVVQAGIVISNSEIGLGSVKIEPLVYRLVCLNGMISNDHSLKKYHVGRGSDANMAEEFFRDETRKVDDRAFWMKVADVIRGSFNKDVFEKIVDRMRLSKARKIEADVVEVVEEVQTKFGLAESEKSGVLKHLISGSDLSQFGLMNAITRTSQDVPDYDRATDLERIGGHVLELTEKDWAAIAA